MFFYNMFRGRRPDHWGRPEGPTCPSCSPPPPPPPGGGNCPFCPPPPPPKKPGCGPCGLHECPHRR